MLVFLHKPAFFYLGGELSKMVLKQFIVIRILTHDLVVSYSGFSLTSQSALEKTALIYFHSLEKEILHLRNPSGQCEYSSIYTTISVLFESAVSSFAHSPSPFSIHTHAFRFYSKRRELKHTGHLTYYSFTSTPTSKLYHLLTQFTHLQIFVTKSFNCA